VGFVKRDLPLIAPGARVVIRDEEWLVRAVDPSGIGVRPYRLGTKESRGEIL